MFGVNHMLVMITGPMTADPETQGVSEQMFAKLVMDSSKSHYRDEK